MPDMMDRTDKSLGTSPQGKAYDKVAKFRWARSTTPGRFQEIHKGILKLDDSYQRDQVSEGAVRRIAADWDWSLFGVLKVAEREDGSLWVFDGGHRLRAAFYRSDISLLPCMVYNLKEISEEARVFIAGAKMSTTISARDTFRAEEAAGAPIALKTKAILDELGMVVKKSARMANEISFVAKLKRCVERDEELAGDVLLTCSQMVVDEPVTVDFFGAMFELCKYWKKRGRDILKEFESRLSVLCQAKCLQAIKSRKISTGKAGDLIGAEGLCALLNNKMRRSCNKYLEMNTASAGEERRDGEL